LRKLLRGCPVSVAPLPGNEPEAVSGAARDGLEKGAPPRGVWVSEIAANIAKLPELLGEP
jgi:hypothetical protein